MESKEKIYKQEFQELRPPRHLWRAFGFFVATGLTTFSCASIVEYYNARKRLDQLIEETFSVFKQIYFGQTVQRGMDRTVAALIALNLMVFVMWRIPNIQPFMTRYFTLGFASKALCLPMLLSVFSHNYFLHFFANMYVMHSFSNGCVGFLGKEQFVAFYLTAGVFTSLVSLLMKRITLSTLPSLGASGAISAMIGYVCTMIPEAQLSIIFLPKWTFSAEEGIRGLIIFELVLLFVGLFTRFKMFDNAAHLAGLSFGIWYARDGEEWYRRKFMPMIIENWRQSGLAPRRRRDDPIIVFDGAKHVQTTMDKLESDKLETDDREAELKRRRKDWEKHRERQLQKQRERKRRILEERNSKERGSRSEEKDDDDLE